jgi:hypothetical protein
MLKIVYPICCGLDVHKDFVYACIATTVNGVTTHKSHRFSTFTKGLFVEQFKLSPLINKITEVFHSVEAFLFVTIAALILTL